MSEIVKPDGIEAPAHFDDVVAGYESGREAEPLLVKQVFANENFVSAGVKTAGVLLRMAGIMGALLEGVVTDKQADVYFSADSKMLAISGSANNPYVCDYRVLANVKKAKVIIWYHDSVERWAFPRWYLVGGMEPEPAFEKLEKTYNERKTLEGKEAILNFYSAFMGLPSRVYIWMKRIKEEQEERNMKIASQQRIQAAVVAGGMAQAEYVEEKLRVLVPDPLEDRIRRLEGK